MPQTIDIEVSKDKSRLQLPMIYQYLSEVAYWSKGLPKAAFNRSIEKSECYGAYLPDGTQVAFARVITDKSTFAYLCDLFTAENIRGQGVSKRLLENIFVDPDLQNIRRFLLATSDAHGLYKKYGFTELKAPDRLMEKRNLSFNQTA